MSVGSSEGSAAHFAPCFNPVTWSSSRSVAGSTKLLSFDVKKKNNILTQQAVSVFQYHISCPSRHPVKLELNASSSQRESSRSCSAMIQANKATVVTEFHKQSLEVRNMELDFYLLVFERISSISALLAGFASTAIQVEVPEGSSAMLKTCYLFFAATALGAHLLVVVVCTMCTMWGPGHALKGREAKSVDHAVEVLDKAQRQMEIFFFLGLVSYFLSCIFLVCFLKMNWN